MGDKIVFKKSDLLGNEASRSKAMRHIYERNADNNTLNHFSEKKQLFQELKKYREGGVTDREMRNILATFKYGAADHFTRDEINALARDIGVGKIEKKHMPSTSPTHASEIDRAHHAANFTPNESCKGYGSRFVNKRQNPGDDVIHYESQKFMTETLRNRKKKDYISGDLMFTREDEDAAFVDVRSGKKIFTQTRQLHRPHISIKSQASLRGRGLAVG